MVYEGLQFQHDRYFPRVETSGGAFDFFFNQVPPDANLRRVLSSINKDILDCIIREYECGTAMTKFHKVEHTL